MGSIQDHRLKAVLVAPFERKETGLRVQEVSNAFGTGVKRAPVAREEIAVYHRAGGQADTRFAATLLDS
jgi:hypothetical protein